MSSKPYGASGAFIARMSNYCDGCRYVVSKKSVKEACPFNAMYWAFMIRNADSLSKNRRLTQIHSSWDRMSPETRKAYRNSASTFLQKLDDGERV